MQNLVEIYSAVMNLRMREKNAFSCRFFVLTYPSIYLSRSSSGLKVTFLDSLNSWLKRRVFATIGAFWGLDR